MSVPPSVISPARRQVEAGEQVDERRLAGAVGADQAEHLARRELEVDVRERLDALERARDAEGPKRVRALGSSHVLPPSMSARRACASVDVGDLLRRVLADVLRHVVVDLDDPVGPAGRAVQRCGVKLIGPPSVWNFVRCERIAASFAPFVEPPAFLIA